MDKLVIFALLGLFVLWLICRDTHEGMAPLNFGAYKNNYPRGKCKTGSFKRTDCMVGNCPLDSTVSNREFCYIQCAQDPDKKFRRDCNRYCMDTMDSCR